MAKSFLDFSQSSDPIPLMTLCLLADGHYGPDLLQKEIFDRVYVKLHFETFRRLI